MTRTPCRGPRRDSDYNCCPFTTFGERYIPSSPKTCEYYTPGSNCDFYQEIVAERKRKANIPKKKSFLQRLGL